MLTWRGGMMGTVSDLTGRKPDRAEQDALTNCGLVWSSDLSAGELGTGSLLVHGENSAVLKALEPRYKGRVRCVYIDPPYNNREQYEHYDDRATHADWLAAVTERLRLLKEFLREDGSLWISIDDREVHYLKVAADIVFGRGNFVTTIIWQQRTTRENRKAFSNNHEYLLVYAKDLKKFEKARGTLELTHEVASRYRNPDDDPRGAWQSVSLNAQAGHATPAQYYDLVSPSGRVHRPPKGRCWICPQPKMRELIAENRVWFGKAGNGVPRKKNFLSDRSAGLTPETLWLAKDVGTSSSAKKHAKALFPQTSVFDTPKPEQLLRRVLTIATSPGDLVLDAYMGSGSTAAVAEKMGRRYIGIEQGDHIRSHCVVRLEKVILGEDPGGVTGEEEWTGGGGFEFWELMEVRRRTDEDREAGSA